ncbi:MULTISPECIES: ABC transporter permease [Rhizobium/Agrobacterium group]|jgi:putative ABC transport system permease protein|uniref:Multidrug ABC transporter substrate-binding protein n=1 Tax=Rhizobium rhizogenes TaxID=359 RepID=A0AA92C4R3_RHIRH|nr:MULTISPECIES: ABC transporter permease [Rhizobium/Agrobacterium group]KQM32832.1 multidrug ABC transporter substrate-binding protein [Rhizobium sp. Leaf202]KQN84717.1 multidrug ABC transporter substrate-binding protein [Rhizobium sp. Leaf68]KQR30167.1 multidrug ABC transporter substrate-binding protein [Rhizobium sp. Leaf155]KRA05768.1 multidrug ABC transporter substrate-binding protein [Rhizobium sp. Root564]MQB19266.1 ABC transporter permease [Agrobacterium tumefaciens]PVE75682.1 multidr
MFFETVRLAMRAISRNMLRSFLTVLGVVIGVAAVIAMVTIGNGTTEQVKSELSRLGTNMLFVRPGQFGPGRASVDAKRFTDSDVQAIRDQISGVRAVAPLNRSSAATVIYGGKNHQTSVVGTTNDYLIAQDWTIALGREFLPAEDRGGQIGCIIGETVRQELFGSSDPVGQTIRVSNISCPVIAVLGRKGQSGLGDDQDDTVIMPLKIHQRRIGGTTTISSIMVSAQDGVSTAKVQSDLENLLRERRRIGLGRQDDFTVNDMAQIASAMTGTTTLLTGLLGAVAAVSLLVGGIGIMNIMLVSVTERTREIGIRLAIGALEKQVLTQFLVEAVMLSAFGGTAGILTGLGLAYAVVSFLGVPFVTSPVIIAVAFAFSAAIGVVFGYFPARRAASLSPIEALRHE